MQNLKTPIFKENYRATAFESLAVLIKLFKRLQSAVVTFFCRFMSFFELVLDLVMGFVLWKSRGQQIETLNARISKMVRHTFKNLQHLLQDYWSVSHHFETLCINSLMTEAPIIRNQSIDLQTKSIDWFLYDRDLRYERVKGLNLNCKVANSCWSISKIKRKVFLYPWNCKCKYIYC